MKFSLVIPTKNRQFTAIKAIKSGIFSNYKNIEIIVSDVSDDDSLGKQINELEDQRVKYFHHRKKLSMKDNWEFGVSQASGDYVSVIGDDDALMPDGYLLAAELIRLSGTSVVHCSCPNYKWPDYSLINRRNLIGLKLPATVKKFTNPREELREAYKFKEKFGTGPGVYHGVVCRKFLNKLKAKRGSYFIDENPDFDSGFCTLLYAESYLKSTYPIFLSGHCEASNSGHINYKNKISKSIFNVIDEAATQHSNFIWSEIEKICSLDVVIVSAMVRFLPEVNKVLKGKKIKLEKQNIFDLLARGIGLGYETTTFKSEIKALEEIAKKWGVSPKAIPSKKRPTLGLIFDKGVNKTAISRGKNVNKLLIDGNKLGVNDILDATKVVDSLTIDWSVLLLTLGHRKTIACQEKEFKFNSFDLISKMLKNGDYQKAESLLEENILANPMDSISLLILGTMYYNRKIFFKAIPNLARSLSFEFNIKGFDAYFNSLIKTNQLSVARLVLENFATEIKETSEQIFDHCNGLLEMSSGNYLSAANIFKDIRPQIDRSIYYYCSAHAEFLKGEAANANEYVKKALNLNDKNEEYLELEAKIKACL